MKRFEQKKELVILGKTDASVPAVTGRYVIDPLVLSQGEAKFSWRQYRFANCYRKTLDLETACAEAGMPRESALRFLRRPDIQRWMEDRLLMQQTKRAWNAEGRWWAEGDRLYQQEKVPKHKVEVWKEFGDRLDPKPAKTGDLTKESVQINIAADVISAMREREKAVEAEITGEGAES